MSNIQEIVFFSNYKVFRNIEGGKDGDKPQRRVLIESMKGEVIYEKQESVKHLLAKFEANCKFPRQKASALALHRINSIKSDTEKFHGQAKMATNAKECDHTSMFGKPRHYISILFIELQPFKTVTYHTETLIILPRYEISVNLDISRKRTNNWTSEAYTTPAKIKCIQDERLFPNPVFQSLKLDGKTAKLKMKDKENENQTTIPKWEDDQSLIRNKTAAHISSNVAVNRRTNGEFGSSSSVLKNTSDDAQADNLEETADQNIQFSKSFDQAGKTKSKRLLAWIKTESSQEIIPNTNSTETEEPKQTINKVEFLTPPSSVELNSYLLREVNSPRKIKSVYTLTNYSTPSSQKERENIKHLKRATPEAWSTVTKSSSSKEEKHKLPYWQQETSQSWPATSDNFSYIWRGEKTKNMNLKWETSTISNFPELQYRMPNKISPLDITGIHSNMTDSFIEQELENGSIDMDSRVHFPLMSSTQSDALFIQSTPKAASSTNNKEPGTPIKKHHPPIPLTNLFSNLQCCSPIALKSRRRSVHGNEPRRSSLAMQVIREGQPLEDHKSQTPSVHTKEDNLSASPSIGNNPLTEQTSQFWINCGYFCISFPIFYQDPARVNFLSDSFSEKSRDSKELYFGVDNLRFDAASPANETENVFNLSSLKKGCSHYWFSTGDLIIPFAGKRLSAHKVQHVFELLKTSIEGSDTIRFGIDDVEFSNVREVWDQCTKFSMDSNYSMLVGLQSGNSNGLEGRSKYDWPYIKPVRMSNVNNFEERDSSRFSFSPFTEKRLNVSTSNEPQPNQFPRSSSEVFDFDFKSDSLEHLFAVPAPVDANKITTHQERLSSEQENRLTGNNPENISCSALDALKGTPQYKLQLKNIVSKIIDKNRRHRFNDCTLRELKSRMSFLSRYAEICLQDDMLHIET